MEVTFKHLITEPIIANIKKRLRSKADEISIKCFVYSSERDLLFAGFSDGRVCMWKPKAYENKSLLYTKEYEIIRIDTQKPHKGKVYTILYESIEDQELVITGSGDRTIKMWDHSQYKSEPCVQTIVGHSGSILALRYIRSHKILVSTSSDKTVRMWCLDSGRQLFRYPWFLIMQVVKDFSSAVLEKQMDKVIWITSVDATEGQVANIFVGDSEGSVIVFRTQYEKNEASIGYSKTYSLVHKYGIISILVVKSDNFVFTTSYDLHVKGFDLTNGTGFFVMKNPNNQAYTSLAWDKKERELYVSDGLGYLGIINVYAERPIFWEKIISEPIHHIQLMEERNRLIVQTDSGMHVFEIKRGVKTKRIVAHTDMILKIIGLDPFKLPEVKNKEKQQAKFITVGLDKRIKLWNAVELTCIAEKISPTEVCSMTVLKKSQLLITGHINGDLKLMNFDLETVSHFDL